MKIPPKRIPSDDCLVYVGRKIEGDKIMEQGIAYAVHKDEWVEILPISTVGEAIAISSMLGLGIKQTTEIAKKLEQLCDGLAKRVTDWNWTGMDGKKLPKPYNRPDVIKSLTEDEIVWLTTASQGETPGQRKNG